MIEFPETSLQIIHIDEPELEFAYGQTFDHPKDGLFLYGPEGKLSRKEVKLGVIGTSEGISEFKAWSNRLNEGVAVPAAASRDKNVRLHLSDFPGLTEAFSIKIDPDSFTEYHLTAQEIDEATSIENGHEAVAKTASLFVDLIIRHLNQEEERVDVWVLVLPELIHKRCRPEAIKRRASGELTPGDFNKKQRARADLPLFIDDPILAGEVIFDDIPDFHRQIKAKLLTVGEVCQLVRETTLSPGKFLNRAGNPIRGVQDPASISWNLATALYYKSQATPPWKISGMREGVCYIGLVFKLLPNHKDNHACCAAQMFLSEGDGVVFRGANGPWMTKEKEFHLSKEAAINLIQTVLTTYRDKFGGNPKELFIHGKTKFSQEEWEAFSEAAPSETNIVAVRIRPTFGDVKLFREGDYPCIRGTAMVLGKSDAFLWTSGYVPRIDTYMGPETPNPISVTVLRSTNEPPEIEVVLRDILNLTKINYNASNYSDSLPVTIRFADKVGDVLVMGSAQDAERQPFKFYV
ncbi:hypothetical protein SAMN04488056_105241 [Cohaesibacter marisflavi]|uniref:Piwi domain-containing protein n=1 Tax=Cohaesibacter marisflavi TaxID=655353 RepID=A0A1I5GXC9_9HYPH|nr:hypothetical protein [Cohaesibacter marisflavi]SFO40662.1 hypothetical protein SAMN04488056_105241 [Cohaesibacter marisflavi]